MSFTKLVLRCLTPNSLRCGCQSRNTGNHFFQIKGNRIPSQIQFVSAISTSNTLTSPPLVDDGGNLAPQKHKPSVSSPITKPGDDKCYKRWEIHAYGGTEELRYNDKSGRSVPHIEDTNDVLVHVHAASVNPIDVAMMKGYGSSAINMLRKAHLISGPFGVPLPNLRNIFQRSAAIEFPLVLGRDFSGVVVEKGHAVDSLKVGDQVYGVLGVQRQGSHANYVVAAADTV